MKKLHILFNLLLGVCPLGLYASDVPEELRNQLQIIQSGMSGSWYKPGSSTPRPTEDSPAKKDLEMAPEFFTEHLASKPEKDLVIYLYDLADAYCKLSKSPNAQWFEQAAAQRKKITQVCTKIRHIVNNNNTASLNINSDMVSKLTELEGDKISGYSSLISLLQDQCKSTSSSTLPGGRPALAVGLATQIKSWSKPEGDNSGQPQSKAADSELLPAQEAQSIKTVLQRATSSGSFAKFFSGPSPKTLDGTPADAPGAAPRILSLQKDTTKNQDAAGDDFDDSTYLAAPPPPPPPPVGGSTSKRLPTASATPLPANAPDAASKGEKKESRTRLPAGMPAGSQDELRAKIAASSERRKSGGSTVVLGHKDSRQPITKADDNDDDDVNKRRKAQKDRIEAATGDLSAGDQKGSLSGNGAPLTNAGRSSGLQRTHSLPSVQSAQAGHSHRGRGNGKELGKSGDALPPVQVQNQQTGFGRGRGRPLPEPQGKKNGNANTNTGHVPTMQGKSPTTSTASGMASDTDRPAVVPVNGSTGSSTSFKGPERKLSAPAAGAPQSGASPVAPLLHTASHATVVHSSSTQSQAGATTTLAGIPNDPSLLPVSKATAPSSTPPSAGQRAEAPVSSSVISSESRTSQSKILADASQTVVDTTLTAPYASEPTMAPSAPLTPQGPGVAASSSSAADTSREAPEPAATQPALSEGSSMPAADTSSSAAQTSPGTTRATTPPPAAQGPVVTTTVPAATAHAATDVSNQHSGTAQPLASLAIPQGAVTIGSSLLSGVTLGATPAAPSTVITLGGGAPSASPAVPLLSAQSQKSVPAPKPPAPSYVKPEGLKMGRVLSLVAVAGLGAWAFKVYYWDPRNTHTSDALYRRNELQ